MFGVILSVIRLVLSLTAGQEGFGVPAGSVQTRAEPETKTGNNCEMSHPDETVPSVVSSENLMTEQEPDQAAGPGVERVSWNDNRTQYFYSY